MTFTISRRAFVGGASASLISCAAPRKSSSTTADVIIIGAGLSGLNAANLIEKAGYKTILLEGNNRTGGRLYTLHNLPGNPDAGGIQVGASYRRFHAIADRLGVERFVPPPSPRGSLYHIGGQSVTAKQWPGASVNLLDRSEKKIPPDALLFRYLASLPQLKDVTDWMKPGAVSMDRSLSDFLKTTGVSDEALRLINANLNGNNVDTISTLHMARSLAVFRKGGTPTRYVRGGSQNMTDAMASALRSDIILNSNVVALRHEDDGVEVGLSDGRKFGAHHVICTAPFAAMRSMKIEADLKPAMRGMIGYLPYTHASFAYLQASEPFWTNDGLPQTIWSDDPMLGRVFVLGDDPAMLKVWLNGASADLVDRMNDDSAGAAIIQKIEAARPSAKGKLKLLRMFSWQKQSFARGIYHHIAPGQGSLLAAAAKCQGQRIHFAGEHLAQENSGMEGALESGERVASHVLGQL